MDSSVDHVERAGPEPPRSLGTLVRAWGERREAPPVALVAAIFDDLLTQPGVSSIGPERLTLDDVRIDARGFASISGAASLGALIPLLISALGRGPEDDMVPAGALGLVARLESEDTHDLPSDAEQLRLWLRDCLGTPAARDEVRAWVEEAVAMRRMTLRPRGTSASRLPASKIEVEERLEIPTALPDDEDELHEAVTLPPAPSTELSVPEPVDDDPAEAQSTEFAEPLRQSPERDTSASKVVRHNLERREQVVSVPVAPAARRSARPANYGPDSLVLPADRKSNVWAWGVAVAVIVVVIYLLFG